MGKIISYASEKSTYHEGRPNTVLSMTPLTYHAVRCTDGEGKETMCAVAQFGNATSDGKPAFFLVANQAQMSDLFRPLPAAMLAQVREHHLSAQANLEGPVVPNKEHEGVFEDIEPEKAEEK